MADVCLTLVCPLAAEERVLDALLAIGGFSVFTSGPVAAHGFAHGALSASEQVSGRGDAAQIQVLLPATELNGLIAQLQGEVPRRGVHYWVTPVASQGEFK